MYFWLKGKTITQETHKVIFMKNNDCSLMWVMELVLAYHQLELEYIYQLSGYEFRSVVLTGYLPWQVPSTM
jgi:hypothetical protein